MAKRYEAYYARPDRISASRLIHDDGDLRILGLDQAGSTLVEFRFGGDALLTRLSDEGVRLRLQRELGPSQAVAFLDRESELIEWLQEETLDTRDLITAKHFILFLGEEAIDVVSMSEPEVIEHTSGHTES